MWVGVAAAATLPYTIDFENLAAATAPAQQVTVTQTLDADLDLSTFQWGPFGFGAQTFSVPAGLQSFQTRVDDRARSGVFVDVAGSLDPAARQITWTFTSIDPLTGALPEDPLAGFLPPHTAAPQGEGWISYSVQPLAGSATSTRVDGLATVWFDGSPLDTPAIFNTLDAAGPASSVAALPAETYATSFTVSWSGQDDAGGTAGSGIACYDVYVSDNGGPFGLWVAGTPDASATFAGVAGHAYAFFSVATDTVGHHETPHATADAQTQVVASVWHNYANPCDVNGIGGVTPLDVLLIINYINSHPSGSPEGESPLAARTSSPAFPSTVPDAAVASGETRDVLTPPVGNDAARVASGTTANPFVPAPHRGRLNRPQSADDPWVDLLDDILLDLAADIDQAWRS